MRLTRQVRQQGYGDTVRQLVDRAENLPTTRVNKDELQRELVLSMGDFVAYPPIVITPSGGNHFDLPQQRRKKVNRRVKKRSPVSLRRPYCETTRRLGSVRRAGAIRRSYGRRLGSCCRRSNRHRGCGSMRRTNGSQSKHFESQNLRPRMRSHFRPTENLSPTSTARVEVWDVATGKKLRDFPTQPTWKMRNAAYDLTNRRLIGGYTDEENDTVGWAVWNLDTGERVHVVTIPSLGNPYPNSIDVTGDGGRMALGFDEALLAYEMGSFQRTSFFGFDATKAVAFSPTHPYLAAVNIRGGITIWNSVTNRQLATLQNVRRAPSREDLAFSADGTHLAASNASTIQVWDLTRANEKIVMTGHEGGIPCVAFHPRQDRLATGGKDDKLRIWDPSSGRLLRTIALDEAAQALAYTADGRCWPSVAWADRCTSSEAHRCALEPIPDTCGPGRGSDAFVGMGRPTRRKLSGRVRLGGRRTLEDREHVAVQNDEVLKLDRTRCLATVLTAEGNTMVWRKMIRPCRLGISPRGVISRCMLRP